jgi:hypothetical protein
MNDIERPRLIPNGIHARTGKPLMPGVTLEEIAAIACGDPPAGADVEELRRLRTRREKDHLDTRFGIDPRDLAQAGWGVVFPEGRQDELRAALAPLLALRQTQATRVDDRRYRELSYRRGESKARFLARYGVGPGPVDPDRLPYYLLLVGDPGEISYRFQYQLDVQHAVGRVAFPTPDELARYAESVVAAERSELHRERRISFFATEHDPATERSLHDLVEPLAGRIAGAHPEWSVETVGGPWATRRALADRLGGERTPALLFSASHGMGFDAGDPRQRAQQGALLCQDWPGSGSRGVREGDWFAAEDVCDGADVAGLIAFVFACYGAGTPRHDSFTWEGERREIAADSFVARLPQRLLAHPRGGALAVIGHVDRAWTFSFDWPGAGVQLEVFNSALGRLLDGYPIGAAMEYFNQRYAEVSTDMSDQVEEVKWGAPPDFISLSSLWIATNDSRSYVVLGDPAVRLAVASNGISAAAGGPGVS